MKTRTRSAQTDPAVSAFLDALEHPLKSEIVAVREIILSVDPQISEGVNWNAPSFRTTKYFATVHLRSRDTFHLGAKARPDVASMEITDPAGLMEWLAKDRCLVTLGAGKDFKARAALFEALVGEWIRYL